MTRTLLSLALVLGIGCGTDSSTTGDDSVCSPGEKMGCECSATSMGTATCGTDGAFGTCRQCSIPDPDPLKVNFRAQIVPIFEKSCGTDGTGCHGRDAYGANKNMECRGWLTLENAALGSKFYSGPQNGANTGCPDMTAYQRIMQLKVWQCLSAPQYPAYYVKPGDPSKSYIMNKLNGVNMCKENATSPSEQMPPMQDADNPNPYVISAADKALIQQWITEGALDN